ncbi:heavy metal-responsive transcriptional regulator [Motiliproteus coralliicola]|uniref:Heavy metal-responsive transcriptional regulator n=1 Tax=Motiliproteus coralliicola TaxID=2283196 RepID=A0A369WAK6_9GAMM|nr:heavy metal-responsive transcriptional regulator [Motiliproteus coralliicola]RDE18209.1 heavy metal-responsive transcriptional regulator [Motiliproteus coralliicola]
MVEQKKTLRIGQVAQHSGVSVETVRYYEQRGLLQQPRRSPSGYREYDVAVLQQLAFISRAKALGFSLEQIGELLQLQLSPEADRSQVKRVVLEKLQLIEERIHELQRLRSALQGLSASCDGQGGVDDCPIMTFLKQGDVDACQPGSEQQVRTEAD